MGRGKPGLEQVLILKKLTRYTARETVQSQGLLKAGLLRVPETFKKPWAESWSVGITTPGYERRAELHCGEVVRVKVTYVGCINCQLTHAS